jgi:hypothetical protein
MGFMSHLSVRAKLLASFAAICVITGIVGTIGVMKMSQINQMLNTLYERELQGVSYAKEIARGTAAIGRDTRQSVLETDQTAMKRLKDEVTDRARLLRHRGRQGFGRQDPRRLWPLHGTD